MPGDLILVIDDDKDLGAVLAELIEGAGYQVILAPTSERAIAALRDEPALVLLDWYLPDGPPIEVAQLCHERGIPVVLSSASEDGLAHAEAVGAVALLSKPFTIDRLYALLESVLGHAPKPAPSSGESRERHLRHS